MIVGARGVAGRLVGETIRLVGVAVAGGRAADCVDLEPGAAVSDDAAVAPGKGKTAWGADAVSDAEGSAVAAWTRGWESGPHDDVNRQTMNRASQYRMSIRLCPYYVRKNGVK